MELVSLHRDAHPLMTKPSTFAIPDNSGVPLEIPVTEEEELDTGVARTTLRPAVQAAVTLQHWGIFGSKQNVNALANELHTQAKAATSNDLGRLESMLAIQAHTLDAVFNQMARLAKLNLSEYPDAADKFLRLALKAQSQCRGTIETLAEIKNPKPVAFVQQANIAAGPQQVNNGVPAPASPDSARAGNSNQSNELLEDRSHGDGLEPSAAGAGIKGHSPMEAMGAVNRPKVAAGKGTGRR
jgi:hypothetical protein